MFSSDSISLLVKTYLPGIMACTKKKGFYFADPKVPKFLSSTRIKDMDTSRQRISQFHLDSRESHELVAAACIRILLFYRAGNVEQYLQQDDSDADTAYLPEPAKAILQYADASWFNHLAKSRPTSPDLARLVVLFLESFPAIKWAKELYPDIAKNHEEERVAGNQTLINVWAVRGCAPGYTLPDLSHCIENLLQKGHQLKALGHLFDEGYLALWTGNYKIARAKYEECLNRRLTILDSNSHEICESYAGLAEAFYRLGEWKNAVEFYRLASDGESRLRHRKDHPDLLTYRAGLGRSLWASRMLFPDGSEERMLAAEEAEKVMNDTLGACVSAYTVDGRLSFRCWDDVGKIKIDKMELAEATTMYTNMAMRALAKFGQYSLYHAMALRGLAESCVGSHQYQEAIEMYRHVHYLRNFLYDNRHPELLGVSEALAQAYLLANDWQKAMKVLVKVVPSNRKVYGPNHYRTLLSILRSAEACRGYGNMTRNKDVWRKAKENFWAVVEAINRLERRSTLTLPLQELRAQANAGMQSPYEPATSTPSTSKRRHRDTDPSSSPERGPAAKRRSIDGIPSRFPATVSSSATTPTTSTQPDNRDNPNLDMDMDLYD
jgi:tetratricopeptide (TPR) repeat protein